MTRVTLGFKAFDPHELLCHFVAADAGLYARHGIEMRLNDITFLADDALPQDWFQASCGAALVNAVRGGDQRVLVVAVDRPLFWIWSRRPLSGPADLAEGTLATYPVQAPPHSLARVILSRAGVDPDQGVELLPARDDMARLGLLRSGSCDAAVLSSAIPPARLEAQGLHPVCQFGDHVRVPTTGVATSERHRSSEPDLCETLVRIHRESLRLMHAEPDRVSASLRRWFDVEPEHARDTTSCFTASFTSDGRTRPDIAEGAVAAIAGAFGVADPPDWHTIYAFD